MAGRAERHQPVEIEVRAPLGALDDVVDLEADAHAAGLADSPGAAQLGADRTPGRIERRISGVVRHGRRLQGPLA
jgi:hypothetical protein